MSFILQDGEVYINTFTGGTPYPEAYAKVGRISNYYIQPDVQVVPDSNTVLADIATEQTVKESCISFYILFFSSKAAEENGGTHIHEELVTVMGSEFETFFGTETSGTIPLLDQIEYYILNCTDSNNNLKYGDIWQLEPT